MPAALVAAALIALPGPKLADASLAAMRGGIRLSDGTNIAVGVALETRVGGILALRTQFSTERPGVQVFAGGPGTTIISLPTSMLPPGSETVPEVRIERDATGTVIANAPIGVVTSVRVGVGGSGEAGRLPGVALNIVENGAAVQTALGAVRLTRTAGGTVTQLSGPDLAIQQLVGQATGTIVANTASNRVIDTVTWVNVSVDGALLPAGLTSSIEAVARAVGTRSGI